LSWKQIVGHDLQKVALEKAWSSERLGQAYFFHGPDGVGKKRFAIELAKSVLCENQNKLSLDSCGKCSSCKLVEGGAHPDLHVFECPRELQEFPIELMKNVCAEFALKSSRGGIKVLVLDDCDKMNEESGNCFLKTLEEPPGESLIILLGNSIDVQLDTILSRCQKIGFYSLSEQNLRKVLSDLLPGEMDSLQKVIPFANGSPGQALAMKNPEFLKTLDVVIGECSNLEPDPVRMNKSVMEFVESSGKESSLQRSGAIALIHTAILWMRRELSNNSVHEDEVDRMILRIEACFRAEELIERRVQLSLAVQYWVDEMLWPTIRKPSALV